MTTTPFDMCVLNHRENITRCGEDLPEITGWKWNAKTRGGRKAAQRKKDTAADNV